MPQHEYYEYFGPDYTLHVAPSNMENKNSHQLLDEIRAKLLDNLSTLRHAPSVQFQERPPDTELPEVRLYRYHFMNMYIFHSSFVFQQMEKKGLFFPCRIWDNDFVLIRYSIIIFILSNFSPWVDESLQILINKNFMHANYSFMAKGRVFSFKLHLIANKNRKKTGNLGILWIEFRVPVVRFQISFSFLFLFSSISWWSYGKIIEIY